MVYALAGDSTITKVFAPAGAFEEVDRFVAAFFLVVFFFAVLAMSIKPFQRCR